MEYRENENNHVTLCGRVQGGFTFSHEVYGEKFCETKLEVERLSGRVDAIPVMVSERLVDTDKDWDGRTVYLCGEMRSCNKWVGDKSHLLVHAFARYFAETITEVWHENSIFLDGYICRPVHYRETPLGREIADMMLSVNRAYGRTDYIPCICWGRNAVFASGLNVGDHIKVSGRVQSREFKKRISETEYEQRTAYEVSISSLEVISDDFAEED